jgi:lysophospholipase L1-like esterase
VDRPEYPNINDTIARFNMMLETVCCESGITYINAHERFLKDGTLNRKYFSDGLHLSEAGYAEYALMLKRFMGWQGD